MRYTTDLRSALHVYNLATSRKRTAKCWNYVATRLWTARANARIAGMQPGSGPDEFVTARLWDAYDRQTFAENTGRLV